MSSEPKAQSPSSCRPKTLEDALKCVDAKKKERMLPIERLQNKENELQNTERNLWRGSARVIPIWQEASDMERKPLMLKTQSAIKRFSASMKNRLLK